MYKVLRREGENLVSCVIAKQPEELRDWLIVYKPHVWTAAKTGKIFVCELLEDALQVRVVERADEVWECRTQNPTHLTQAASLNPADFRNYWGDGTAPFAGFGVAQGTFGADKIKLVRRVYPKECLTSG